MNTPYAEQITALFKSLPAGQEAALITAAVFAFAMVGSCVGILIRVICRWRYFSKAGDSGWKALIPVYSTYTEYTLFWKTSMFWLLMTASLSSALAVIFVPLKENLIFLAALLSVIQTLIALLQTHKLSLSFGHGIGFTLGLIFLRPAFLLILAFGRSRYIGPAYR